MSLKLWLPFNGDTAAEELSSYSVNQDIEPAHRVMMNGGPITMSTTGKLYKCADFSVNSSRYIYTSGYFCDTMSHEEVPQGFGYSGDLNVQGGSFSIAFWVNLVTSPSWSGASYRGICGCCADPRYAGQDQYIFRTDVSDGYYGTPLTTFFNVCGGGFGVSLKAGGHLSLVLNDTGTSGVWDIQNSLTTINNWGHVCFTYDHTTRTATYYLNGVEQSTHIFDNGWTINTMPFYIGRNDFSIALSDSIAAPVKLNEFRLYDHCLMPGEIKELARCLFAHYKFEHGSLNDEYKKWINSQYDSTAIEGYSSDDLIKDNSGHGFHLEIQGGAPYTADSGKSAVPIISNNGGGKYKNSAVLKVFGGTSSAGNTTISPELHFHDTVAYSACTSCTVVWWAKYDGAATMLLGDENPTSNYIGKSFNYNTLMDTKSGGSAVHMFYGNSSLHTTESGNSVPVTANVWCMYAAVGVNLSGWSPYINSTCNGTYHINRALCVDCGLCLENVCPGEAIVSGHPFYIVPELCVGCGSCELAGCPADAITEGRSSFDIPFNGQISDLRIYNSVLTDADLKDMFDTQAKVYENGDVCVAGVVEHTSPVNNTAVYNHVEFEVVNNHNTPNQFGVHIVPSSDLFFDNVTRNQKDSDWYLGFEVAGCTSGCGSYSHDCALMQAKRKWFYTPILNPDAMYIDFIEETDEGYSDVSIYDCLMGGGSHKGCGLYDMIWNIGTAKAHDYDGDEGTRMFIGNFSFDIRCVMKCYHNNSSSAEINPIDSSRIIPMKSDIHRIKFAAYGLMEQSGTEYYLGDVYCEFLSSELIESATIA